MLKVMDKKLLLIIVLLLLFGIVAVYSATSIKCARSSDTNHDSTFYLKKQLTRVAIGLIGMFIAINIDYRFYKKVSLPFLIFTGLLLLALTIPQFAKGAIKGANRWLEFGNATLQPSELAKLALIIFLAEYFSHRNAVLGDFFKGFLPAVAIVAVFVIVIIKQPNFGMAIAILIISSLMFFVAGARLLHLAYLMIPAIPALFFAIIKSEHALKRIITFWKGGNPLDEAFQITQSLIAIGSGRLFGKGMGQGIQKLFYIPEIQTDFIFTVIAEELGFLGAGAVLVLFLLFAWRGLKIAMRAGDAFGQYLAFGLTAMIFVNASLNIGVVMKVLPTTGIPLPFISYGGSALLVNMIACGILLNISAHVTVPLEEHLEITIENPTRGIDACSFCGRRDGRASHSRAEYRA